MRFLKYIIVFVVLIGGIYFGVDYYVDTKVDNCRSEAYLAFKSFFEDKKMYIDLLYAPCRFNYEEMAIPQPHEPSARDVEISLAFKKKFPQTSSGYDSPNSAEEEYQQMKQNAQKVWERKYGQFFKMFKLDIFPYESEDAIQSGWALKIIEQKDISTCYDYVGGILIYNFYPDKVACKQKSSLYWGFTTIEQIVLESLKFYTENNASWSYPYYSRGCTDNLLSQMKTKIDNEYFSFEELKVGEPGYVQWGKDPLLYNETDVNSVDAGSMYNNYYEVFCKKTQPKNYEVKFIGNDVVQEKKYKLMAIWAIISIVIVICFKKIMD